MLEYSLNIIGSEWVVIIFVILILLLGTNRFPEAAKKIGKVVGEFNKAKNQVQNEMKDITRENIRVTGPVKDERQKLEIMANTLGVDSKNKTDNDLKRTIERKMGQTQNKKRTKK